MLELLTAFADEMMKLAAPRVKAVDKVSSFHQAPEKNWGGFEQDLRSPAFRKAVIAAQESDPKLKKYTKVFGGYVGSKDVVAEIKSKDSGKIYKIKDLHNGRLGCGCKNWQFIHSINGGDCKHIKSVKASKLVKISSPMYAAGVGASYMNWAAKAHTKGKKLKMMARAAHGQSDNSPSSSLPWDQRLMKGTI